MSQSAEPQVVITGAGPAGVVAAMLLQRAGTPVLLIGAPRRFNSLEGLAERACRAFVALHCTHATDSLQTPVRRLAQWGGQEFAGNHEYLIERNSFDAALRNDARDAGVMLIEDQVTHIADHDNHWLFELPGRTVTGQYWIDARGRAAPRSGERQRAPAVIAIAAWWQGSPGKPAAGVSPFRCGWAWFARFPCGRTCVQLFIDASVAPSRRQLQAGYLNLLQQCPQASQFVTAATQISEPFTRAAQLTYNKPLISTRAARVGDAALAMDPLAGHGIFEAAGSAMTLAPSVRTILTRSESAELAMEFYQRRMDADFWTQARSGRDFYAMETRWPAEPFWSTRRVWPDTVPPHASVQAGQARISREAVLIDGFIEARDIVVSPDQPRGVWQVDGVPLVPMLRLLASHGMPSGEALPRFVQNSPWPDPQALNAIRWLDTRGLLNLARVQDEH